MNGNKSLRFWVIAVVDVGRETGYLAKSGLVWLTVGGLSLPKASRFEGSFAEATVQIERLKSAGYPFSCTEPALDVTCKQCSYVGSLWMDFHQRQHMSFHECPACRSRSLFIDLSQFIDDAPTEALDASN